jgi:hypothetical protein
MEKTIPELCDILEVSHNATASEVKQAYRDLVRIWHPDKCHGDERLRRKTEEKLKAINEAYQVLRNGVPAYADSNSSTQAATNNSSTPYQSSPPHQPFPNSPVSAAPSESLPAWLALLSSIIAAIACMILLPSQLGKNVEHVVDPGGWFSSPTYKSIWETSWGFVMIYSLIIVISTYAIVRSKNIESLWGLIIGSVFVVKVTRAFIDS